MDDSRKMRPGTMSNSSVSAHNKSNNYSQRHPTQPGNSAFQPAPAHASNQYDTGMGSLTGSFGGMNLAVPRSAHVVPQHMHQAHNDYGHPVVMNPMTQAGQSYLTNGQLLWNSAGNTSAMAGNPVNNMSYATPQYLGHNPYSWQGYMGDSSLTTQGWANSRMPSGSTEVPSLITPRRDSDSSNELDGPGTPYGGYTPYGNAPLVLGHSPDTALTWTPSPSQPGYAAKANRLQPTVIPPDLQAALSQEPLIPQAVPAPYSPTKPLDRALENPNGNTNVYIRGLQPETTDEMLVKYAKRFGEIASSKAIIDHATGLCKGFGFVKYHSYPDAERCIRGFFYRGYESSFARESFYAQLKKLHDDQTTNLYVSNLPKTMNEHELAQFFHGYKVCSSRILRTNDGTGRGVGFARFDDRETCEEVIKKYNNTPVGVKNEDGEEQLIQIRYADTPEQKALKQQTTAARQYRTAEYESQTRPRNGFMSRINATSEDITPEFETYMKNMNSNLSYNDNSHVGGNGITRRSEVATIDCASDRNVRPNIAIGTTTKPAVSADIKVETVASTGSS